MPGCAEFANDEGIQRHLQGAGHFEGDRQTATGQTQDHHIGLAPVRGQQSGQNLAGFPAVGE